MATIAFDSFDAETRPPITEHPAFPAIVALWFAVLLGLGTLALPGVLLERVVAATGIASLVPAASPPLGITARVLLALAAALLGAGLGVAIARRVAPSDGHTGKLGFGLRAPLNVKDELGEDGLVNGEALPLNRRRALAISDEVLPDAYLYDGPLTNEHDEPFELSTPVDEERTDAFPPGFADEPVADEDFDMTDEQHFQPEPPEAAGEPGPPDAEPLAFAAPSLARHTDQAEVEVESERDASLDPAATPLEELGLFQLVQRLGTTIERRREWLAEAATPAPVTPAPFTPAPFEAAPADEAAQAMAAYFGSETATAAPVDNDEAEEIDEDEDEDAGPGYSSLLGMNHPFARLDESFEPVEAAECDDDLGEPEEDGRPFDPPAGDGTPQDADSALRAALATLQRMSGTA